MLVERVVVAVVGREVVAVERVVVAVVERVVVAVVLVAGAAVVREVVAVERMLVEVRVASERVAAVCVLP